MPFGLKTPGHLLDARQQNICRWDIKANLKKIRALIEMMSSQKLKEVQNLIVVVAASKLLISSFFLQNSQRTEKFSIDGRV